jgi:hypothetical protein
VWSSPKATSNADREVRSTAYQAARFPNYRDLASVDFASSEVNQALVELYRCEFQEDAHNVVVVGGHGTDKGTIRIVAFCVTEAQPAKVGVEGSNPFARSNTIRTINVLRGALAKASAAGVPGKRWVSRRRKRSISTRQSGWTATQMQRS